MLTEGKTPPPDRIAKIRSVEDEPESGLEDAFARLEALGVPPEKIAEIRDYKYPLERLRMAHTVEDAARLQAGIERANARIENLNEVKAATPATVENDRTQELEASDPDQRPSGILKRIRSWFS